MLNEREIKKIFADCEAIITGDHFVYAKKADGWYHGEDYVNKDAVLPFVGEVCALCRDIAAHFSKHGIETVVGPTVAGVVLSQWTTHWLMLFPRVGFGKIHSVYADEEDILETRNVTLSIENYQPQNINAAGIVSIARNSCDSISVVYKEKIGTRRIIKRGYDKKHVKGKRCLIAEDVLNSGATVVKTRDAILAAGGKVVGVGCLCNRSGGKVTAETLGVPELFSLLDVDMKMFKEESCPICAEKGANSVRTDLGKGKEFLSRVS